MDTPILYDLAIKSCDARPSPFCWLAKFGFLHKGIAFDTRALGFLPKTDYPDPDYGRVPVLDMAGERIKGSEEILAYLESVRPEPPLTVNADAAARAEKHKTWVMESLFPALAPMMFPRVHAAIADHEKDYFREAREERFGMTLEEMAALPDQAAKVEAALSDPAAALGEADFFGGDAPDLSDYRIASPLMWQVSITNEPLYAMPSPLAAWFDRLRDHFGGYGRKAACAGA